MNEPDEVESDPFVMRTAESIRGRTHARPQARDQLIERLANDAHRDGPRLHTSRRSRWAVATGGLLAAGIAVAILGVRSKTESLDGAAATIVPAAATTHLVEFAVDAPAAQRVMLVGEFNNWNDRATPMRRSASGRWTASLALESGRHLYSFDVGAGKLISDPGAPSAPENFFGVRHSVVMVP